MAEQQLVDFGHGTEDLPGLLDVIRDYFCINDDDVNDVDALEEFAERTCLDLSLHSQPEYGVDTAAAESDLEVDRDVVQVSLPNLPTPLSHTDCVADLHSFIENGCCSWECAKKFPSDMIRESRLDCLDYDFYCESHVNHHHILMLGAMNTLVQNQPHTMKKDHAPKPRKESRTTYMFRGVAVCRDFFMFVFGTGIKRLKNVKKHMLASGINAKKHGKADMTNQTKCLTLEKREKAVQFIENYSEQNALVMPGRIAGRKNTDLKLLPTHMTKRSVYSKYEDACYEDDKEPMTLPTWYATWLLFCSHIVIQKPRTDLCAVCQQHSMTMSKLKTFCDNEKRDLAKKVLEHIDLVTMERGSYISVIEECRQNLEVLPQELTLSSHRLMSYTGKMHQSFDFAQQVFLPQDSQQVGPLYFLCGYKVGLFGIAVEPLRKFVLYIIPEAAHCGKGSNVVISLLHHFYTNFSVGETDTMCHADNCCGQNKNNFMMQYCLWRTATGHNQSFQISFMPVGHTKFWPDLLFGLFKKRWRREKASTVADVQRIARDCCPGKVIPVAVGDEGGKTFVPIYDWQSKFKACGFHKLPEIKKYHHFYFTSHSPGKVTCKTSMNSEPVSFILGDASMLDLSLPSIINPQGLNYARKMYLYNSIRPYVPDDSKDILCPLPDPEAAGDDEPEPGMSTMSTEEPGPSTLQEAQVQKIDAVPAKSKNKAANTVHIKPCAFRTPEKKRRKTPTCSYCHHVGHRNQTVRGKLVCPKRREDSCTVNQPPSATQNPTNIDSVENELS